MMSTIPSGTSCSLGTRCSSDNGLRIYFYNLGGRDPCVRQYGHFRNVLMAGKRWRTANGLQVGDPMRSMLRYLCRQTSVGASVAIGEARVTSTHQAPVASGSAAGW